MDKAPRRLTDLRRHWRNVDVVVPVVAALLSGFATWWATATSMAIKYDSVYYLSAAENLARGNGLLDYRGDELTNFPPGYPALLRLVMLFGTDAFGAARFIAIASSIAIVALVALIAYRIGPRGAASVAAVAATALPAMIVMNVQAMSEPVFTVALLVLIASLLRLPSAPSAVSFGHLVPVVLASWACCLIRYQGYAVLIATAVVLALRSQSWKSRILLVGAYALSAGLVVSSIVLQSSVRSGSLGVPETGSRGSTSTDIDRGLSSLGQWMGLQRSLLSFADTDAIGIALVIVIAACLAFVLWRARTDVRLRQIHVVLVFLAVIPLFTLASARKVWVELTPRMIFPIFPLAVLVVTIAITELMRSRGRIGYSVAAFVGAAILVLTSSQSVDIARDTRSTPRGLSSAIQQVPELGRAVAELDDSREVYSNNEEGVWLSSRRDWIRPFGTTIRDVEKFFDEPSRPVPQRRADFIESFIDDLCAGFHLAWSDWNNPRRPSGRIEQLEDFADVTSIRTLADGELFLVTSSDPDFCNDPSRRVVTID